MLSMQPSTAQHSAAFEYIQRSMGRVGRRHGVEWRTLPSLIRRRKSRQNSRGTRRRKKNQAFSLRDGYDRRRRPRPRPTTRFKERPRVRRSKYLCQRGRTADRASERAAKRAAGVHEFGRHPGEWRNLTSSKTASFFVLLFLLRRRSVIIVFIISLLSLSLLPLLNARLTTTKDRPSPWATRGLRAGRLTAESLN